MNGVDVAGQAAKQTAQIVEGAKLSMAFKTDAGRVIADSLVEAVSMRVDALLWKQTMSDEESLRQLYEIRGILSVVDAVGDSVQAAVSAVSRNAVNTRLRMPTRRESHEEDGAR